MLITIDESINGVRVEAAFEVEPNHSVYTEKLELDGIEFSLHQLEYLNHPVLPEIKCRIGVSHKFVSFRKLELL
jgi:hypothetical protein